jgi:tetratricopeptide (TPR) repeat protein
MRRAVLRAVLVAVSAAGAGCTAPRAVYSSAELRTELGRRVPPAEVVVPYELSPEHAARARALVAGVTRVDQQVDLLAAAVFDPRALGLRYAAGAPGTAEETLARGGGDCLALASVFIGMARAVGLDASYIDASIRVHETQYLGEEIAVNLGHVTAAVRVGDERIGLDFARAGRIVWYRLIDDAEAVAHFYNNRGYAILDRAEAEGRPADWAAAAHQFQLALQVKPGFARAWNNLGLADAHLGRRERAMDDYREAIAHDGELAAPHANLGSLQLEAGDLGNARAHLEVAARLEPGAAHVQYALALVRLRSGDRPGAVRALERAVSLREGWRSAQLLLDQLRADARSGPGPDG